MDTFCGSWEHKAGVAYWGSKMDYCSQLFICLKYGNYKHAYWIVSTWQVVMNFQVNCVTQTAFLVCICVVDSPLQSSLNPCYLSLMPSPPLRSGWAVVAGAVSEVSVTVSWEVRCWWWTQSTTLWQRSCTPIQTSSRRSALLRTATSLVARHAAMARSPSGKSSREQRWRKHKWSKRGPCGEKDTCVLVSTYTRHNKCLGIWPWQEDHPVGGWVKQVNMNSGQFFSFTWRSIFL